MKAPAHFFKFIQPDANSHHSIPISFHKFLKSTRKNEIAILRRGDQEWEVKMGKDWVFGEGWDDFKTENGVQDFDIVVFKHEGSIVFDTMVFDPSWCEREYSTNQVRKSVKKRKPNNNELKISKGKNTCINQPTTRSLLKAENNNSKTMISNQNHHPHFVSTLKRYGGVFKYLYIPKKFGLANGLSNCEMILKNAKKEGLWTAHLRRDSGNYFKVEHGWRDFCSAIGVAEGDNLLFELIHSGKKPVAFVSRLSTNTSAIVTSNEIPNLALTNPYFRPTLTPSNVKSARVNIPLSFARSNKLVMRNCELLVTDEKKRLWPTRLCDSGSDSGGHVRIYKSRQMLVANGLKEGDVFLLELVDNGNKPLMNLYRDGGALSKLT